MRPVICFVTDRRRFGAAWEEEMVARVQVAARAGVHLVQLRERDLDTKDLLRLASRCVAAVAGTRARVLINDRMDVACAAGAHGVHLPANGVSPRRARAAAPAGFLIGCSVHDPEEAARVASDEAADYLIFGTVFSTPSKPATPGVGLALLNRTAEAVHVPVLAIGGMTPGRLASVAASGASGFAAIGLFADGDAGSIPGSVHQASVAFDTLPIVRS